GNTWEYMAQEKRAPDYGCKSARVVSFASGSLSEATAPADAMMMALMARYCSVVRRSPRRMTPAIAAIAGSKLMSVPNVLADSLLSANISSVYGNAPEKTATPKPNAKA